MKKLLMSALLAAGLLTVPGAPAQAQAPECTNANLVASYRATGGGMSHEYGRVVLRNVSDTACTIRGYGGLSYVGGGDGSQVGAAAKRSGRHVPSVLVGPGQRVVSTVAATDYSPYPKHRCRPAPVDGFRVYLPDETRSQYVPHPTTGCRNHRVHLLQHGAYRRP